MVEAKFEQIEAEVERMIQQRDFDIENFQIQIDKEFQNVS